MLHVFIAECILYGYFLLLILRGTCFFLVGNQTVLDALIKIRLIYSTYLAQGKRDFINQTDNELGYTLGQDKETESYKTNAQGIRSDQEYTLIPSDGTLRVAVFGDSFVFCDGVSNPETWQAHLENSLKNIEVMNFGVPGYSLTQTYLRLLKDGLRYSPDVVLINQILLRENDRVNPKDFVGLNNLRLAHFYRVTLKKEDDILISKAMKPYDIFNPEFRERSLYGTFGKDRWLEFLSGKFFSLSNIGLFIKGLMYKGIFSNTDELAEEHFETDINIKLLHNIFKLAQRHNFFVIFFYGREPEHLPRSVQHVLNLYNDYGLYVNVKALLEQKIHQDYPNEKNFRILKMPDELQVPDVLLTSTNHFNNRGNQLVGEVIAELLTQGQWDALERKFIFDENRHAFLRQHNNFQRDTAE